MELSPAAFCGGISNSNTQNITTSVMFNLDVHFVGIKTLIDYLHVPGLHRS